MRSIAAALLLFASLPSNAQSVVTQIRTMCEREWPSDFVMQEHCIKQQTEAARRLGKLDAEPTSGRSFQTEMGEVNARSLADYQKIMAWLNKRGLINYKYAELEAMAPTNQDAATYTTCMKYSNPTGNERRSRMELLLACLPE